MKIETLDIRLFQTPQQMHPLQSSRPQNHVSEFFEQISQLFDNTVDHFIVNFMIKEKKASIKVFRQSLVLIHTLEGIEKEIPFAYSLLSQPASTITEINRRAFFKKMFQILEAQIKENKCQVLVKRKEPS